jgi:hypothetical protein
MSASAHRSNKTASSASWPGDSTATAGPTPEAETPEEPAEAQAAGPTPRAEIPSERRPEGPRRYVLTAGIFAGVLVFALAFFMAGFAAHALLDEDDGGGTAAVGQPSPSAGTPTAPRR